MFFFTFMYPSSSDHESICLPLCLCWSVCRCFCRSACLILSACLPGCLSVFVSVPSMRLSLCVCPVLSCPLSVFLPPG